MASSAVRSVSGSFHAVMRIVIIGRQACAGDLEKLVRPIESHSRDQRYEKLQHKKWMKNRLRRKRSLRDVEYSAGYIVMIAYLPVPTQRRNYWGPHQSPEFRDQE